MQLTQKLTKRVRAQFDQPDRPSGAQSAATLDQAEARAHPRPRRQRSRDVTAQPDARTGPGPLTRTLGRAINSAVTRFPWSWRLVRGPVRRFFDAVAVGWDERVRSSSPEYVMPLQAALDRLQARPARILDVGTGTGAAALKLARRYPEADVVGIDVSAEMVAQARARAADLGTYFVATRG